MEVRSTMPPNKANQCAVLAGCACGSALVNGTTRPAIEDYISIRILTEMPKGAEEIATMIITLLFVKSLLSTFR